MLPLHQPERGLFLGRETWAIFLVLSKCLTYLKSTKEAVGHTVLMASWAGRLGEQLSADTVKYYSP